MPEQIIQLDAHPLHQADYRQQCRARLDRDGALVLRGFLTPQALAIVREEGERRRHQAFYANSAHNVYLLKPDAAYADDHPRNRAVVSSKGCITDEEVPADSPLRALYHDALFKAFLCEVLNERQLYPYADSLSSINLHYAHTGQELGWHFDNSSFAITLLIQKPLDGGQFEYVNALRDADAGEMNFDGVAEVLEGRRLPDRLAIEPGDLVLFRGRNAMHRVTPTQGEITRMLAVLAYNAEPGVSLSETARMTFYGRV